MTHLGLYEIDHFSNNGDHAGTMVTKGVKKQWCWATNHRDFNRHTWVEIGCFVAGFAAIQYFPGHVYEDKKCLLKDMKRDGNPSRWDTYTSLEPQYHMLEPEDGLKHIQFGIEPSRWAAIFITSKTKSRWPGTFPQGRGVCSWQSNREHEITNRHGDIFIRISPECVPWLWLQVSQGLGI